jgi:hypothetical protein
MRHIAGWIARVLERPGDAALARDTAREVRELADAFPLFTWTPGPRPGVRAG